MLNVFLYRQHNNLFELFLSKISTINCLARFEPNTLLKIKDFGVTCYKNYGFATDVNLPKINKVKDLHSFLVSEFDIGLIICEIELYNIGVLTIQNDSEAHFKFVSKTLCIKYLKKVLPAKYSNSIIYKIVNNPNVYISCDRFGNVAKHSSFKDYVSSRAKLEDNNFWFGKSNSRLLKLFE